MEKKMRWAGLLFAAAAVLALGCPKSDNGGGGSSGGKLRIAVIPKGTAASYWQTVKAGAEVAAKQDGLEIIWQGPSDENDITGQINIVQNQISSHVDAIVLAATSAEGLIKPVQDAIAKGIPVVTIDSGLSQPVSYCFIATDNVKGGALAADALAAAIGQKGNVGLLPFNRGAGSSDDREKGFLQEIAKYPNIQVASKLYANDPSKALDMITNMMTAHPDIVGIFACNEPGGIGAANYLKQQKLEGKVKLVAYDTSDEEVKALQAGTIQALIVQDPFQMGYRGVQMALKAIRKQPADSKFVDSGVTVVTKDNFNTPKVQQLLNPKLD